VGDAERTPRSYQFKRYKMNRLLQIFIESGSGNYAEGPRSGQAQARE